MKKVMLIFLFVCTCAICYAANVPEWSEFCPEEFVDPVVLTEEQIKIKAQELADEKTKVFYCKSDKTYAKILRGITVLPAIDCWCANKLAGNVNGTLLRQLNEENKYWSNRKKQFMNELTSCDGLTNDAKGMCYLEVRKIEHQKNDNRQVQANLKAIQKQLWYNNLTDSLAE